MADYIMLLGSEQVQNAAHQMQSAADQMQRAVSSIDDALERHRRWADDWLEQFRNALELHTSGEIRS